MELPPATTSSTPAADAEPTEGAAEPVILVIADISGYTRYMTANAKTLAHSQTIITELVKTIVKQVELPLEVAKLEGDAVFLYARKRSGSEPAAPTKKLLGEKLLTFFDAFIGKASQLSQSTTCSCNACAHIEKLRLKLVVHSGEALFHQVLHFQELAGVDVIIVHRLLKNSVRGDQYLLMTEAAAKDLELPGHIALAPGSESYEDIGRIKTLVYLPGDVRLATNQPASRATDSLPGSGVTAARCSFAARLRTSWNLFTRLWFSPFQRKAATFHHLDPRAGKAGRIGFALLTALLTPIFLPIGFVFVLGHTLKPPKAHSELPAGHKRNADGSRCGT